MRRNYLKDEMFQKYKSIGASDRMKELKELIGKIAKTDTPPVFVYGESGTGKELVARNIHIRSARAHKPFSKINCAGIPDFLVERELFEYEKRAFTGAIELFLFIGLL